MEDIEFLDGVMPELDQEHVLVGKQTPMFFGSAMTNFGVELFLKRFFELSRPPAGRRTHSGELLEPTHNQFTGFIFKLQANIDPRHRDRMAYVRVCSGTFKRGMKVNHSRMKRQISLSQAQALFAQVIMYCVMT
jgi:peptide chain release factor 3